MVKNNKRLSELGKLMVKYPQILVNVRVKDKTGWEENQAIAEVVKKYTEELGDDGQVLVRASGTEPLIRIMAQGPNQAELDAITDAIASLRPGHVPPLDAPATPEAILKAVRAMKSGGAA